MPDEQNPNHQPVAVFLIVQRLPSLIEINEVDPMLSLDAFGRIPEIVYVVVGPESAPTCEDDQQYESRDAQQQAHAMGDGVGQFLGYRVVAGSHAALATALAERGTARTVPDACSSDRRVDH